MSLFSSSGDFLRVNVYDTNIIKNNIRRIHSLLVIILESNQDTAVSQVATSNAIVPRNKNGTSLCTVDALALSG